MSIKRLNRAGFVESKVQGEVSVEINKESFRITDPSLRPFGSSRGDRGGVTSFSYASKKRLVRLCANNSDIFKYFVTLTYHDIVQSGKQVKSQLNRFLTVLRKYGVDKYIWVLEFQKRGSIHYHLWLSEHQLEESWREDMPPLRQQLNEELADDRLRKQAMVIQYLWLKASNQLGDQKAVKAAIDYQVLRSSHAVKVYALKYGAKLMQKSLPQGVTSVGRWWGASHVVRNEKLVYKVGDKEWIDLVKGFCKEFGFPSKGIVVAECEQATEVWKKFLEDCCSQ